jgi:hypothetical protein
MAISTRIDTPSVHTGSGTPDDDDDPNDERADENEAPVRELDDRTEAPEEFEVDDEDEDEPNESGGTLRIDEQQGAGVGDEWTDVDDDDIGGG